MAAAAAAAAAATSSLLLRRPISRTLLLRCASPGFLRTNLCYSASATATPPPPLSPPDTSEGDGGGGMRWESTTKKRVVLRVGYVGTEYRAIESVLESAIFKAGGILESNYGKLQKVHSLATMISLKMEIPDRAWEHDPDGIALASFINSNLPKSVRVFSILPAQRNFDVRRECLYREYFYLLPAEIIGIKDGCSLEEVQKHLSELNSILKTFEGNHPFHNYTARAKYRKVLAGSHRRAKGAKSRLKPMPTEVGMEEMSDESTTSNHEEEDLNNSSMIDFVESEYNCTKDIPKLSENRVQIQARWLHEPDESDRLSASHFRDHHLLLWRVAEFIWNSVCGIDHMWSIFHATSDKPYVTVLGSFGLVKVRKMVGTAVAVKRGLLPRDIIDLSLAKFSRIVLPIAPSEVLLLKDNSFHTKNREGRVVCPGIDSLNKSVEVRKSVQEFYKAALVPELVKFLDPSMPPWKEWVENLDQLTGIPDSQLDEVREAYRVWKDAYDQVKMARKSGSGVV
ncbi:hypothetical protein PR202_gb19806 [Eleusine coracana subsp. coracana]|uniref:Uncharacterized protein n=1 Tax=Eleusine coracana subsp. coracana TaxID=191504 RepID=A0AAV5FAY9_ELECO|nr:hypothetical protein PR202_gb19806 [Eleusine coracana subsp. coracana]